MEYIIIILVNLICYYKTLFYGIVVDDIANRNKNQKTGTVVRRIWYALDGQAPVKSYFLDHLITLSLHTLVCTLIYQAFGSIVASLLFAVNLSNNQVAIWLNGKRYAVSTILCLAAYILAPVGILIWLLVPMFQASGLALPVIFLLTGHWWTLAIVPLIFLVGKKYIIKRIKCRANMIGQAEVKRWNWRKPALMLKTLAFYFVRGIVPFSPTFYISYLKHYGMTEENNKEAYRIDLSCISGLLIIISIIALYIADPTKWFGFMWWLVFMLVYSNWTTLTVPFAERYMYLPNAGLMLGLAEALNYLSPFAWMIVFGIYIGRLYSKLYIYKDSDTLFKYQTDIDPTHDCAWNTRISEALMDNNVQLALSLTDEALTHINTSPRIWVHKSNIHRVCGDMESSKKYLTKAYECLEGEFDKALRPKLDQIQKLNQESSDGNGNRKD